MRTAIRSLISLGALVAAALPFFTHNVHALDPATCNGYADRAVEQSTRARTLSCGFKVDVRGVAWSIDRNAYIRECLAFRDKSTIQNRSLTRDAALERCAGCRNYASTIIAQNLDNKRFSCGFQGENWVTEDGAAIFELCMDERHPDRKNPWPARFAPSFLAERASELVECKSQFTPEQIEACRLYAEKASEQAAWNRSHKCGGHGPRWTMDAAEHFRWCTATFQVDPDLQSMQQRVKEQEQGRHVENEKCHFQESGYKPAQDQIKTNRGKTVIRPPIARAMPSSGLSTFGGGKSGATAPQGKPVAIPSSAMDRLGAGPASGGSYKSKDGAPGQTRSSGGGAGTASSPSGELPNLRTMPANTGAMTTGGGTPAWKGSVK